MIQFALLPMIRYLFKPGQYTLFFISIGVNWVEAQYA